MTTLSTNPWTTTAIAEAIAKFKKCVFAHPLAKLTFHELSTAVDSNSSPQVIIFTGPTGVGKSTLVRAVRNHVLNDSAERMALEPDFVPVVNVSAIPPNSQGFSWKDFYIRLLSSQQEPLVDRKLLIPRQRNLFSVEGLNDMGLEHGTVDTLRRATEAYLRRRRVRLLIIDEAHHMLLLGSRQKLEYQFESIKSLCIETGVPILLAGTYRLLDILEQSGQLTRRSQVVDYPRYKYEKQEDRENFQRVLLHFEKELSIYLPSKLMHDAEFFYLKSAGCVGILKDWLTRCLEIGLKEQTPLLDAHFAKRLAHNNRGVRNILTEAFEGETLLKDVDDLEIQDLLKNGIFLGDDRESFQKVKMRPKPGKRGPSRDPVGRMHP